MKPAPLLAAIVFSLVAIAHLLRIVFRVEIIIGGVAIPIWVSILATVIPGALAVALFREAYATRA